MAGLRNGLKNTTRGITVERDYRRLEKGEIIKEGDEIDRCADSWRDDPVWEPAGNIGEPAPYPQYPSHRQYRRPLST